MDRSTLRRNPETDRVDLPGWSFLTRVYRIICIVGLCSLHHCTSHVSWLNCVHLEALMCHMNKVQCTMRWALDPLPSPLPTVPSPPH
jgi:hypothetical protein